jgi:hypothetical protein
VQKIIDRVQKLLALAGNNANENEALAALEKAHAILAEHNLTMAEVGAAGQAEPNPDEVRDSLHTDTNMPERYNRWIWNAVAQANSCFMFSARPNPKRYQTIYTMVGRRINCVVATQMALYLCQTMKRLASEECKRVGCTDHAYKNAYLVGMAVRLCERIRKFKEESQAAAQGSAPVATGSANALVLWSENEERENRAHVENEMKVKLKSKKQVANIRYNAAAMAAGERDAEKVSLSQQVAGRSPQTALA